MLKKVLFFALLPLLLSAAMPEKPFVLARNGKAACQIVLSEKANKFGHYCYQCNQPRSF